jgi:hypothetical protein
MFESRMEIKENTGIFIFSVCAAGFPLLMTHEKRMQKLRTYMHYGVTFVRFNWWYAFYIVRSNGTITYKPRRQQRRQRSQAHNSTPYRVSRVLCTGYVENKKLSCVLISKIWTQLQ